MLTAIIVLAIMCVFAIVAIFASFHELEKQKNALGAMLREQRKYNLSLEAVVCELHKTFNPIPFKFNDHVVVLRTTGLKDGIYKGEHCDERAVRIKEYNSSWKIEDERYVLVEFDGEIQRIHYQYVKPITEE